MATDWAADVKKYAPDADDGVIAGIVRYCGIALRKVDSSLVAFSDKKETDRVRENFLKKKLGLTQADKTLDAAIAKVGETMKADRTKNRVTVYYLLAANFKKLDLFAPKAKAAAKAPTKKSTGAAAGTAALAGAAGLSAAKAPAKQAPAKKPAAVATTKKTPAKKVAIKSPAAPQALVDKAAGAGSAAIAGTVAAAGAVAATAATAAASTVGAVKETTAAAVDAAGDAVGAVAGVAGAAVAGAAGLAASTADKAGAAVSQLTGTADDEDSGLGWLWWLLLALLAAFLIWWLFLRGPADEAAAPAPAATEEVAPAAAEDLTAAPAEGSVEIPAGAGVTSELRDGKPVVKVYFDTAKTELAPAFAGAAGGLKAWLEANAGSSLAISGYSDPSGDAAANAELAKNRAQAVQAALVAAGIAETSALLVKPEQTSDATVPPEAARRVEVVVK